MVMIGVTEVDGLFEGDPLNHPRYDERFTALQAELFARSASLIADTGGMTSLDKASAETASEFLSILAEESVSPCISRIGRSVDPWDERLSHLRELAKLSAEALVDMVVEQVGIPMDDPRVLKLSSLSSEVAAKVCDELDASIQAVLPDVSWKAPAI